MTTHVDIDTALEAATPGTTLRRSYELWQHEEPVSQSLIEDLLTRYSGEKLREIHNAARNTSL